MDPYCKISFGTKLVKSKVHNNAGKYPQWNDTFTFQRTTEEIINLEVWDKDTVSADDLVF
jgi:Ca2+-dependent lipid-binding protein